jgi:hypothetical protein
VTNCELAGSVVAMASATGYIRCMGDELPPPHHLPAMTLATVRQLQAAEKAAKDAFWAAAGTAGSKMTTKQVKLQAAMIAATKARQAAMTEYAASLA